MGENLERTIENNNKGALRVLGSAVAYTGAFLAGFVMPEAYQHPELLVEPTALIGTGSVATYLASGRYNTLPKAIGAALGSGALWAMLEQFYN